MVHGLSVVAISVGGHFSRGKGERAPLIGGESEGLEHMVHDDGGVESENSSGDDLTDIAGMPNGVEASSHAISSDSEDEGDFEVVPRDSGEDDWEEEDKRRQDGKTGEESLLIV